MGAYFISWEPLRCAFGDPEMLFCTWLTSVSWNSHAFQWVQSWLLLIVIPPHCRFLSLNVLFEFLIGACGGSLRWCCLSSSPSCVYVHTFSEHAFMHRLMLDLQNDLSLPSLCRWGLPGNCFHWQQQRCNTHITGGQRSAGSPYKAAGCSSLFTARNL